MNPLRLFLLLTTQAPTTDRYADAVPALISAALDEVIPGLDLESHRPPLLVHLASFTVLLSQVAEEDLSKEQVGQAMGRAFRDVTPASAVRCSPPSPATGLQTCSTPDDGVYVELAGLLGAPVYEAVLTLKWTHRSEIGRHVLTRRIRVWFRRGDDGWVKVRRVVIGDGIY